MRLKFQVGLGYRRALHPHYFSDAGREVINFVELAPENYAGLGGDWRRRIEQVRAAYPVITHGLALSLGGHAPLDAAFIEQIAPFIASVETPHHSDHLCWSSTETTHTHELLPIEMTRANAKRVAARVRDVASSMPVPMAIENISAYMRHGSDELDEPDFVSEVVSQAGCKLMLDVNNVYVNSLNFGFDAVAWIRRFPLSEAVQMHVAGHKRHSPELVIDTHSEAIADPVYELLAVALKESGPVPVLLERDGNYPPFEELLQELKRIRTVGEAVFGG